MKIHNLAFGFVCTASLFGQHKFSWQNACFNNPSLPYCQGRDYAVKPVKGAGRGNAGTNPSTGHDAVVGGIDWRFADPSADTLVALNFSKLSDSRLARSLITELGASQGLTEGDIQKIFKGLSGVNLVALSVRDDRIVLMVTGVTASTLPVVEAGWKAAPVGGNAMLIGYADAVDQAVQRIAAAGPVAELASMAEQWPANREFWAFGSGKLGGREAVSAGVKQFWLTATIQDFIRSDAAFEFNGVPDSNTLRMWPAALGGATIDGNMAHARMSVEADEMQQRFGQIAASPFGQRLGALLKAARSLPARDTAPTAHPKPVIYGLDGGPKEVKQ